MLPLAPGLLSMMTDWPQRAASLRIITRAKMSRALPGLNDITVLLGKEALVCACTRPVAPTAASAAAVNADFRKSKVVFY